MQHAEAVRINEKSIFQYLELQIESFLLAEKYQGPNSFKPKRIVKCYISSTAVTSEQRQQNLSRKNLSWNIFFCVQKQLYLGINKSTSFLDVDGSHLYQNTKCCKTNASAPSVSQNHSLGEPGRDPSGSSQSTAICTGILMDPCSLLPPLVCKMTEFPEGTKYIFKTEFKTTWCRKLFSFLAITHNRVQDFSTKIIIAWLPQSPCCCLAKFATEEFLCPLVIPTDTERWTCERIGFCQGLFPLFTDIQ